jgi:hypothetical protein
MATKKKTLSGKHIVYHRDGSIWAKGQGSADWVLGVVSKGRLKNAIGHVQERRAVR